MSRHCGPRPCQGSTKVLCQVHCDAQCWCRSFGPETASYLELEAFLDTEPVEREASAASVRSGGPGQHVFDNALAHDYQGVTGRLFKSGPREHQPAPVAAEGEPDGNKIRDSFGRTLDDEDPIFVSREDVPPDEIASYPDLKPSADPYAEDLAWVDRFATLQRACYSLQDQDGCCLSLTLC